MSFTYRVSHWAAQPSTFFLLLNACLITGLLHYWSSLPLPGQLTPTLVEIHDTPVSYEHYPIAGHQAAHRHQNHAAAAASAQPNDTAVPVELSAECGAGDVFCATYGADILARSRSYEGANSRFHRVLRNAKAGKPIKIAVLGGSVSRGQGVQRDEVWVNLLAAWFRRRFPKSKVIVQNGAVAATGSGYMSMCFKQHIDDDADLVITELAINDQRQDTSAESFEWMLRQLLEMPNQPAVLNMQTFGLGFSQLSTGGDLHTAVAQYYDTPIISLRNALLPQLLANRTAAPEFFSTLNGKPDFKHVNHRGHQMMADLFAAYTERQLRALDQRDTLSKLPTGRSKASVLLAAGNTFSIPPQRLFQNYNDSPAPALDPFCASTRTKRGPLVPAFNEGWADWSYAAPGGSPKKYLRATTPGARAAFSVPVREGLGRVRLQFLQSSTFGLGIVKCWLDEDTASAVYVDGFWKSSLNLAGTAVISMRATPGDHTLWCELTGHSSSPNGGTEFRIIGVDAA